MVKVFDKLGDGKSHAVCPRVRSVSKDLNHFVQFSELSVTFWGRFQRFDQFLIDVLTNAYQLMCRTSNP